MGRLQDIIRDIKKIPENSLFATSFITILGQRELLIENFQGIIEYSETVLRVKTKFFVIRMEGSHLFLKEIMKDSILIEGRFEKIEFLS